MALIIFADTSNHTGVSSPRRWSDIYEFISVAKPCNRPPPMALRDIDEDFSEIDIYDDELVKIQRFEIYKVASIPVVLLITNAVQWVATHVDFRHLAIVEDNGKVLGILTPENFQSIYHLKPAKVKCNKEYLDNFYIVNPKAHMLMKPWYQEDEYFKDRSGIIFNWASILSDNILRALEKAIQRPNAKGTPFYFSGFLLDDLCASNQFPGLKWAWTPKFPPIHIY
jgi:hypothetical protein